MADLERYGFPAIQKRAVSIANLRIFPQQPILSYRKTKVIYKDFTTVTPIKVLA